MASEPTSDAPGAAGSRWPLAAVGLYLLAAYALGVVATSLTNGAYHAWLTSQPERVSDLGGLRSALEWGLRLFGYLLGAAQLVALALVLRGAAPVRSMAGVALAMSAAELGLGLLLDLGYALLRDFGGGAFAVLRAVGWVDFTVAVVAEALVFETLLRLRREASGGAPGPDAALRAVFWAGLGPRLALWALAMLGVHRLLPPWPMAGVRLVFTLLVAGASLAAIRAALLAVEATLAGAAPSPQPAALAGAGAAGRESGLRNLGLGALWMLLGGGVTAFTYASAPASGGRYLVATGALAAGLVQAVVGLVQLTRSR